MVSVLGNVDVAVNTGRVMLKLEYKVFELLAPEWEDLAFTKARVEKRGREASIYTFLRMLKESDRLRQLEPLRSQ